MSILFKKTRIGGGLNLRNRFVRSATYEAFADNEGCCTPELLKCYSDYSKGEVGLIMSSCTQVDPMGKHHPTMLSLVTEKSITSYNKLVTAVQSEKSSIGFQLVHSGMAAKPHLIGGKKPETPDTMSRADIERVIENFGKAASAVYALGSNAVQIHCSANYLLASYLSEHTNHRADEFGGNTTKRFEIVSRIISQVRKSTPSPFTVMIKMNGWEDDQTGLKLENAIKIAELAADQGVDAIEVNAGLVGQNFSEFKYAKAIKAAVKVPVISTGGYRTLSQMENSIKANECDFIGLSRPLIREPDFVRLMREGKTTTSKCISCGACLVNTSRNEKPLRCMQEKK